MLFGNSFEEVQVGSLFGLSYLVLIYTKTRAQFTAKLNSSVTDLKKKKNSTCTLNIINLGS